jgi:ADP-heptose:LPS heptosyltransferase
MRGKDSRHRIGRPRTIAILRALQLGDLLCAIPAWRALRRAFPEARIALIGLPWAYDFVGRFHRYLDEWIVFPGYPGLPERPFLFEAISDFIDCMRRRRFDLVLQMHGDGRITNRIAMLLEGRITAGFYGPGAPCPDPDRFCPYPDDIAETHRHLRFIEFLGLPSEGDDLEFPLTASDEESWRRIRDVHELRPGSYVCVHPGGRGIHRRWPAEQFARVADALAEKGWRIIVTGTVEEQPLVETMERAMSSTPVNLMGRTDLGGLAMLLNRARLLVTNDTGVSHMAVAFRLPSVVISTGSDPIRWGPLDRCRHRLLLSQTATVDSVLDEVQDLLNDQVEARCERRTA